MEDLIAQGAENIDLVTPTQYLPTILPALEPKLPVPVVYNCGGYERVETLKTLEGKVDIYLPDLKYSDRALAQALSGVKNYCSVAKLALTDAAAWAEAETLARTTEFLELATLPEFQDEFVEQLNFEDEDED